MTMNFDAVVAALTIPSITALGCITAYVYSEQKGIKASLRFLKGFFPNRRPEFYFRVDFFLSAVVGTGIGVILYSPTTTYQALAAGIGWTAAFNIAKFETSSEQRSKDNAGKLGRESAEGEQEAAGE